MSGTNSEETQTIANEVEARAAMWLRRRYWDWDADCQTQFDAWLGESWAHRVAFWRLEAAWERTERLAALSPMKPEPSGATQPNKTRSFLFGIAASIAAVIMLGFGAARWQSEPNGKIYSTPIGGHETITLADGSSVELNTDTVLRVAISPTQRVVTLERGEAYFQIKHDATHPFVVSAAQHRIIDLGTKFLVHTDADNLQVTLVEGLARVETSGEWLPHHTAMLTPGDVVVASAESMLLKREPTRKLASELSWRQGVLMFNRTALADAAAEFNRYNKTKLIIADPVAAGRTLGGTFRTNDVEGFTEIARDLLGLRAEKQNGNIVITR